MEPNLRVGIRPHFKPTKEASAEAKDLFHPLLANQTETGEIQVELPQETIDKFRDAREQVAVLGNAMTDAPKRPGEDIVVVPLGTGSAIPGRYRTGTNGLLVVNGNMLIVW